VKKFLGFKLVKKGYKCKGKKKLLGKTETPKLCADLVKQELGDKVKDTPYFTWAASGYKAKKCQACLGKSAAKTTKAAKFNHYKVSTFF